MSTDTDDAPEWSDSELLAMNERDARETLTVAWFERWEQLNDLHAEADETREQWREEDATVQQLTVNADLSDLGTEVELYGNDLVVRVDPEAPELRRLEERYEDATEGFDAEEHADDDAEDFPEEMVDEVCRVVLDFMDAVLVSWNGVEWGDVPEETRRETLEEARDAWGVDGLVFGKVEVVDSVRRDHDERQGVVESFRSPERRGRR